MSPDGRRFIMLRPISDATRAANQVVLVDHWFQELVAKVKQ